MEAPAFASSASAGEDTRGVPIGKSVCGPLEAQVGTVGVTLLNGLAAWGVLLKKEVWLSLGSFISYSQ